MASALTSLDLHLRPGMGFFAAIALSLAALPLLAADAERNSGSEVVVLYNSTVRESKDVAEYYAAARRVPAHFACLARSENPA